MHIILALLIDTSLEFFYFVTCFISALDTETAMDGTGARRFSTNQDCSSVSLIASLGESVSNYIGKWTK